MPASNAALPHCRAVLELPPEVVDVAALMAEGGPTTEEPFTDDSGDDTSPDMDNPDPLDYPAVVQALMVCTSPPPAIEQCASRPFTGHDFVAIFVSLGRI
jgi:hypothetical protein